jgi:3',5'-cyclic AMP phosphodiesterase CpdA
VSDLGKVRDRLLHVADLHFWQVVLNPFALLNKRFLGNLNVAFRRRREFATHRAEAYSDALGATGIPSALFTGDFTSTSIEAEFAMARAFVDGVQRRGIAPIVLPGNHDVYTFEAQRARRFESHFDGLVPDQGYPSSTTLPGGTPVILVPTVSPTLLSSKGTISPEQIQAAAALLDACDGPVVVAAHYPVLHHTYGYASGPGRRLRNAQSLREMLGASGRTVLYVCGHVHRFSHVQDPDFPSLQHLSTGAFFRNDRHNGTQGEFSEIHVADGAFHVLHHVNAGTWKRELSTPNS